LEKIIKEIRRRAAPKKARILQRFFKTGKGEYGEGDIFLGLTVPQSRKIAAKFRNLKFVEIENLLKSKYHEERLIGVLILVEKFQNTTPSRRHVGTPLLDKEGNYTEKERIFKFYLKSTKYINNWDLVDLSADKIVGQYLLDKSKDILFRLAHSENLWERRISIVATYQFIKDGRYQETLTISKMLLNDQHDLIHKAVGWMLREVGKKCSEDLLVEFLGKHYKQMPRTMLRYAIERLQEKLRKKYLS
jgi:3-methyladenine DNA glycosylase AlkD